VYGTILLLFERRELGEMVQLIARHLSMPGLARLGASWEKE
jgi:hypothetical protein